MIFGPGVSTKDNNGIGREEEQRKKTWFSVSRRNYRFLFFSFSVRHFYCSEKCPENIPFSENENHGLVYILPHFLVLSCRASLLPSSSSLSCFKLHSFLSSHHDPAPIRSIRHCLFAHSSISLKPLSLQSHPRQRPFRVLLHHSLVARAWFCIRSVASSNCGQRVGGKLGNERLIPLSSFPKY